MLDDYPLIEASFLQQYGIRLSEVDMSWREFSDLLSCIDVETPLGNVIRIRSETDSEVISQFNKAQRKIYNDWNRVEPQGINDLFNAFR